MHRSRVEVVALKVVAGILPSLVLEKTRDARSAGNKNHLVEEL